jgi:hypothetical protein
MATRPIAARAAALLGAAVFAAAQPASAHHSWSADYDLSRSAHVSGSITRVMIRNPHSAIVLAVNADNGRSEQWTVEWASPQRLRDRGVTAEDLRIGDELFVTGNPHRNAKIKSLRAVSVRRAGDGSEIGARQMGR